MACASYAVQIAGSIAFIAATATSALLLLFGIVLFGAGIVNATSLPPLIAQVEFPENRVPRVVSLIVAVSQAAYAFAAAIFGLLREFASYASGAPRSQAPCLFAAAAFAQGLAISPFGWAEAHTRLDAASLSVQPPAPRRPPP